MDIIIVRHGLSEANRSGVLGTDSNLAPEGRKQAKQLADRLKNEAIDVIYCSPLKRTTQTALPPAEKTNKEIFIDRRLREVEWGDFDGKPDDYFIEKIGQGPRETLDGYKFDFHKYNGESSEDVEERVRSFVDELKTKPYKKVLIVCHGGIVRMLHFLITGEKITWQPNAEELHLTTSNH